MHGVIPISSWQWFVCADLKREWPGVEPGTASRDLTVFPLHHQFPPNGYPYSPICL